MVYVYLVNLDDDSKRSPVVFTNKVYNNLIEKERRDLLRFLSHDPGSKFKNYSLSVGFSLYNYYAYLLNNV